MASCSSRTLRWTPRRSCFSVSRANQRFDQIKPGAAGGSEMQMKAGMALQPTLDGRGLVSAVIVQDQIQLQLARQVDGFQKAAKLLRAVATMEFANHGAGLGIERSEQIDGAVTHIVRGATFGLAGSHRQQRL